MKKCAFRYLLLLLIALLAVSNYGCTNSLQKSKKFPPPVGYVNDFCDLLTEEEEKELSRLIGDHEKKTTNQIVIVTVDSIAPYETLFDYSMDLANEWGVGQKDKNNGVMIAISMHPREIRLNTGKGVESTITDAEAKSILDEKITPNLKAGNIFLGLKDGIESVILELNNTSKTGSSVSKIDDEISAIFEDSFGNYWIGTRAQGVYKYNGTSLLHFDTNNGLCGNSTVNILEDSNGHVFFDMVDCISKYDGQSFESIEITKSKDTEDQWKLDPNDLWFSMGWSSKGPYRYDGKNLIQLEFPAPAQAEIFYKSNPNASYSPYGLYTIYKDDEGVLWFGTASLGICRFDGKTLDWMYEKQLTHTPQGGDFGIRSIIEDQQGDYWFCNTTYRYEIQDSKIASKINYQRKNGATENDTEPIYYNSIAEDSKGNLWMSTYDEGLYQFNGEKLIHHPIKKGEKSIYTFTIFVDHSDVIWLGTSAGVYWFKGQEFVKFELP